MSLLCSTVQQKCLLAVGRLLNSCVRNGASKNLLSIFIFGGCSMLVVKQAEQHLVQGVGQQLGMMKAETHLGIAKRS